MKRHQHLTRRQLAALIAACTIAIGSVSYAALQSQDKLTGNTIETATANLQISSDGTTFSTTQAGYDFNNLIPGGAAMPQNGYTVTLRNSGGTGLALRLAVSSTPTNLSSVDLSKVNVLLTSVSSNLTQTFTLQSLIDASTSGGVAITTPSQLAAGNTYQYKLQVSMASDAISGSSASLGNIDFAIAGIAGN